MIDSKLRVAILVLSGSLFVAGFGLACDRADDRTPAVSAPAQTDRENAYDDESGVDARRQMLIEKADELIRDVGDQVRQRREEIETLPDDARERLRQALDHADAAREKLRRETDAFANAAEEQWDEIQDRVSAALDEVEEARHEIGRALAGAPDSGGE